MVDATCTGAWIETYTGRRFDVLIPQPSQVDIYDIAHALSNQCRWSGHCKEFYSVAQHSVLVSLQCPKPQALNGLLHDASESYLGDFTSPLKYRTAAGAVYRHLESLAMNAIKRRFSLLALHAPSVKKADLIVLATEIRDLFPGHASIPTLFAHGDEDAIFDPVAWAWAVGLFEGEGCIVTSGVGRESPIRLALKMTDGDSVERFRSVVGFGVIDYHPQRKPHHKPTWTWRCYRKPHAAFILKRFLQAGMSKRRTETALKALASLKRPEARNTRPFPVVAPLTERIVGWAPQHAKNQFLRRFAVLTS